MEEAGDHKRLKSQSRSRLKTPRSVASLPVAFLVVAFATQPNSKKTRIGELRMPTLWRPRTLLCSHCHEGRSVMECSANRVLTKTAEFEQVPATGRRSRMARLRYAMGAAMRVRSERRRGRTGSHRQPPTPEGLLGRRWKDPLEQRKASHCVQAALSGEKPGVQRNSKNRDLSALMRINKSTAVHSKARAPPPDARLAAVGGNTLWGGRVPQTTQHTEHRFIPTPQNTSYIRTLHRFGQTKNMLQRLKPTTRSARSEPMASPRDDIARLGQNFSNSRFMLSLGTFTAYN